MKKKKEETLPEQGCGDKVAVEKETTNEVVENETVKEEASEEQQKEDDDLPEDDEGGCIDIHASGKDFLEFLSKLLLMMKEIVMLEKRLREFEKDPTFDLLMDLCMAHLEEMKESDKEDDSSKEMDEPSDEESDEDQEEHCDDDGDTIAVTHICMKVKKVKS
jgi:hypothetical protein